jgi:hypothetical protein
MPTEATHRNYRRLYERVLRLYPATYQQHYAEGMAQTFSDVLREHDADDLAICALGMFIDTLAGIVRENMSQVIQKTKETAMQNRNIVYIALATLLILAIPLVAMQFTSEVQWTALDFGIVAFLLLGTGLAYEFTARRLRDGRQRVLLGVGVLGALLVAWGCLGVGHEHGSGYLLYLGAYGAMMVTAIVSGVLPKTSSRA